jgi:hypothetical protein
LVTAIEKAAKNPELNRLKKEEYEIANTLAIKMGLKK